MKKQEAFQQHNVLSLMLSLNLDYTLKQEPVAGMSRWTIAISAPSSLFCFVSAQGCVQLEHAGRKGRGGMGHC